MVDDAIRLYPKILITKVFIRCQINFGKCVLTKGRVSGRTLTTLYRFLICFGIIRRLPLRIEMLACFPRTTAAYDTP